MVNIIKKLKISAISVTILLLATSCQSVQSDTKNIDSTAKQNTTVESKSTETNLKDEKLKVKVSKINSGLLLGLVKDKEANKKIGPMERIPDDYRTLWICQNGDSINYIEKNNIITPYKNEFWKLENNRFNMLGQKTDLSASEGDIVSKYSSYYNFFSIVSYPASKKVKDLYTKETFEKRYIHGEGYMGEEFQVNTEWLTYAGNKYVCILNDYYQTGGGSFGRGCNDIKFYEIGNLNNLEKRDKSIKLVDLLGEDVKENIKKYTKKYNKVISSDNHSTREQLVDPKGLTLKRKNGKWIVQAPVYMKSANYGNGSTESHITEFIDTDIKLPDSITSYDKLCIDWSTIKEKIPQAKDAVSSPDNDMLAVLTLKELLIFTNPKDSMEKPSLVIPVGEDESIILNQWATGEYVGKWSELLNTY